MPDPLTGWAKLVGAVVGVAKAFFDWLLSWRKQSHEFATQAKHEAADEEAARRDLCERVGLMFLAEAQWASTTTVDPDDFEQVWAARFTGRRFELKSEVERLDDPELRRRLLIILYRCQVKDPFGSFRDQQDLVVQALNCAHSIAAAAARRGSIDRATETLFNEIDSADFDLLMKKHDAVMANTESDLAFIKAVLDGLQSVRATVGDEASAEPIGQQASRATQDSPGRGRHRGS